MDARRWLVSLVGIGMLAVEASCMAAPLRDQAGPYEVQVLVGGSKARTFAHDGETYVLGQLGARYTLRVVNHSGRRVEAVVSVDGRDGIDGQPADFRSKRGYLVPAWGQVDIDGWRLSGSEAAAFRFSSVASSYAGRTGSAREVGVVGVAVFPERAPPPPPRPVYTPMPRRRMEPNDPCCDDLDEQSNAPTFRGRSSGGGYADKAPAPSGSSAAAPAAQAPAMSQRDEEAAGATATLGKRSRSRSGLGTEFGEAVSSPIHEVEFVRASTTHPQTVLGLRYNDREGLLALGIDVDGSLCCGEERLRRTAEPFPVVDRGYATPPPGWSR